MISRSAVLTVSRLSNFAIQLFSPLLLVRILDIADYGQYQEFMIHAMLLATLCTFSIDSSITYFIPRFPEQERAFVTQASILILAISSVFIGILLLLKPLYLKFTTYDFVMPLACYVLFFTNLSWLENYWIVKRKTGLVFYYSALRVILRISVLLIVAYTTRDVFAIIWSIVVVEGCRVLLVFVYFSTKGMFRTEWQWSAVIAQLKFSLPVGISAVIQSMGRNVGKLFISMTLGTTVLAYYMVGSYLQPIIRELVSGMRDAVYPELVRSRDKPVGSLRLWQRANIICCGIFFPAFVLIQFYATEIVTILFTVEYLAAVPVFKVLAFLLICRCFNADVLLRSTGKTGFMIWGSVGALSFNITLILLLSKSFGMIGPAVALVAAEVMLEVYNMQRVRHALKIGIADFADWRNILRVAISCGLSFPILIGFSLIPGPELFRMAAASILYLTVCFLLAYRLGVADIGRVACFALSLLQVRQGQSGR